MEKGSEAMATEKLYYADAYLKAFDATVLSCEAAKNGSLHLLPPRMPLGFLCL